MDEFKRGYLYARAMHTSIFHNFRFLQLLQEADRFMARFLHHEFFCARRKRNLWVLASVWVLGLGSGIWAFAYAGSSLLPLMRSTLSGTVSIVSLLCVTGLPFLFSAFAVFISCHWLIFPIAFCKGFCFSFAATGLLQAFGSAGWLIRPLLCFADSVSMPLLYWFWLSCFRTDDRLWRPRAVLAAALLLLLGSVDYCLISPFLADLIIM